MFYKRLTGIIAALITAVCISSVCFADGFGVLQTNIKEQKVDVFVSGEITQNKISCTISNQTADIVDSGFVGKKGITVRTTVLIDTSASMTRDNGQEQVLELLDEMIEKIGENEEYRIVTFGESINEIQKFTSDRYDLSKSIQKIVFNDKKSTMYDAIYNTLPKMEQINGEPCFYRTIVISDGEDLTQSFITKEEVYSALQSNTYPVDTVLASSLGLSQPTKDMMAISRISGGKYYDFRGDVSVKSICSSLSADDVFWIRLEIPKSLLDGSVRYLIISDGSSSNVEVGIKVPAVISESSDETVEESDESKSEESSITSAAEPEDNKNSWLFTPVFWVIIASAAVVIIVTVVLIVVFSKKKHTTPKPTPDNNDGGRTEFIPAREQMELYIRLRNIDNPDMIWELKLANQLLIGRNTACEICLQEGSVARQQCKIYKNANGVATLENMSGSNITELNGTKINFPQPIKEGDKIKCGRIILMVDSLYYSGTPNNSISGDRTMFLNV